MAMRKKKKAAKGKAKAKNAKRAPAKKVARKKAAPKKKAAKRADPGAALAALARKIVSVTSQHGDFLALYSPDVVSEEAAGAPVHGFDGLNQKLEGWNQMQEGTTWSARSVATDARSGTIIIEWDCQVKLRGGPTVPLKEVAVHQVKNGKIVAERYYYNPAALSPPADDAVVRQG
jgi:ketosteroid isomerase-like protein